MAVLHSQQKGSFCDQNDSWFLVVNVYTVEGYERRMLSLTWFAWVDDRQKKVTISLRCQILPYIAEKPGHMVGMLEGSHMA